jgi:hypothetical protein
VGFISILCIPLSQPECATSSECPLDKACIGMKCIDPCISGPCAPGATCRVVNHSPICSCPSGFTGNPFVGCQEERRVVAEPQDPCRPSPCGPFSECRNVNNQPACSCLLGYIGRPPNCRPECTVRIFDK